MSMKKNSFNTATKNLKDLYKKRLLPLEKEYLFNEFHSPLIDDADFNAKPMVLIIGQYSTGKSTLINCLAKTNIPGLRIGPEPTTDKFIPVMYGDKDDTFPGHYLVSDKEKPFRELKNFGNGFLKKFQCSQTNSKYLENISLIDTPGILNNREDCNDRGYDFKGVFEWFAERVDLILLLFDANKLDISDEFKSLIFKLKPYDEKIRIVLNKVDLVNYDQLLRIYGALMYKLGKILFDSEVPRVYICSFWQDKISSEDTKVFYENDVKELFDYLNKLPDNSVTRKINDIVKRARLARAHSLIIGTLKKKNKKNLLKKIFLPKNKSTNLADTYEYVKNKYNLPSGDFPNMKDLEMKLKNYDFGKFKNIDKKLISNIDKLLDDNLEKLVRSNQMRNDFKN